MAEAPLGKRQIGRKQKGEDRREKGETTKLGKQKKKKEKGNLDWEVGKRQESWASNAVRGAREEMMQRRSDG